MDVDWHEVDPERLFDKIRERGPAADAERTVWAFEQALVVARIDGELLSHVLGACVCLLAYDEGESPRTILEQMYRRAVSDGEWRDRFVPLFA